MKTKLLLFCIAFAIVTNVSITAKAQAVNVTDSLALVDFYNSTNGPNWTNHTNWLTGPVKTWFGVTVTGTRVTQLNLYDNQISGSLPSSIGNLTNLTFLFLSKNQLSGSIPSSIGNLVNLTTLYLPDNQLSGDIPSSIGGMTHLTDLALYSNQLSGSVPSSIGDITNLGYLNLSYNQLSGSIPSSIGNLVNNLTTVFLNNNQLSGSIPSSFGNLVHLGGLYVNNNQLSGSIPASFSKLKFLFTLDASYNHLSQNGNSKFPNYQNQTLTFNVRHNDFTFDGLEFVAQAIPQATYSQQAPVSIHRQGNALSVYAGGTLSKNTYYWFKVGDADTVVIKGDSTFHPAQSGMYYAKIKNAIAKKLTLITDTVNYTMPLAKNISAISVYPNPVRDILTINGLDAKSSNNITVADASGHVWLNETAKQQLTVNYNVSTLKAGYYVLHVSNGTTVNTVKFMKE